MKSYKEIQRLANEMAITYHMSGEAELQGDKVLEKFMDLLRETGKMAFDGYKLEAGLTSEECIAPVASVILSTVEKLTSAVNHSVLIHMSVEICLGEKEARG